MMKYPGINSPAAMQTTVLGGAEAEVRRGTELEAINDEMARAAQRLSNMLEGLEGKMRYLLALDTPPTEIKPPPFQHASGTLPSLHAHAGALNILCDQLDDQLTRLFGVI